MRSLKYITGTFETGTARIVRRLSIIASPLPVFFAAYAIITVAFASSPVCGAGNNEYSCCELDPAAILTIDSEQQDEEAFIPDISIPPVFSRLNPIAYLPGASQPESFVAAINDSSAPANPESSTGNGEAGSVSQLERRIWKTRLDPLLPTRTGEKTDELKKMIEQIRSVQFDAQYHNEPQPAYAKKTEIPATDPVKTIEPQSQPIPASAETAKSGGQELTGRQNEAMQVEELLKDPNRITSPFELAEVLYRSGRIIPAGLCYKRALASINAGDPNMTGDRAWVLFQIGNCFKFEDPNASKESYAELVRNHPDSPWAQIARSQHGLVDWYQKEQPAKLINELKR